jgi:hypothetical protein
MIASKKKITLRVNKIVSNKNKIPYEPFIGDLLIFIKKYDIIYIESKERRKL